MAGQLLRIREPVFTAKQGKKEKVSYGFDWVRYGIPASPSVKIEDESDESDLSATLLEAGSPVITGTVVATQRVLGASLVRGNKYRLSCTVTAPDGNQYEAYGFIIGDR